MHSKGLCIGCADLYRAWAYYHEAVGDFTSAHHVFELGKNALAQPYDELENAHKNLVIAAGQHVKNELNHLHTNLLDCFTGHFRTERERIGWEAPSVDIAAHLPPRTRW